MCPVYYFNIKINLDIYNYLGLFFKYNNDLDFINQSLDIKNKVFLFSVSEGKYYLEDFSKYKYISIEIVNCGSKIFPVRLLNIMQITDEISRTTSSTYFIHAFFIVQNNKLTYHSCYTSGYDKQDLYVYGIL